MTVSDFTFITRPSSHRARLVAFSAVGAGIFWLGIGLQALLTGEWRMSAVASFTLQGVVSVQLSYLLNRYWTWRAEQVPGWRGWRRFNIQKVIASLANLVLYAALLRAGVNYLAANLATTAAFTVLNYAGAHCWAFRSERGARPAVPALPHAAPPTVRTVPTVSVVVPCRGNERTIRATVDALLAQDHPGLAEVILVGSTDDSTWQALRDVTDPRLVLLERPDVPGVIDSNAKRDVGIRRATGEVLALADSDIVLPPHWLSRGLELLAASGASCVAGGMASSHDSFWGRFVDGTRLAAKTPRVPVTYLVTAADFGRHGRKPPVTANVIFTRELYRDCPVDAEWAAGYEDYEWFWRIAVAGHRVLFSSEQYGRHHHRRGLRKLSRDYLRSGSGCARFVRSHPGCPLSRKRLLQAVLLPAGLLAGAAAVGCAAVVTGQLALAAAGGLASVLVAVLAEAGWEFARRRNPEALLYPLPNLVLGCMFLFGLARGLIRSLGRPVSVTASPAVQPVLGSGLVAGATR